MGILKQGILGGFSGKVANVVGTSWKGIAVIKAMPLSVANPKTAGQVAQRTKFANVSLFAVVLLSVVIKPLWDRFSIQMSGFNAFVKTNIDLFASNLPSPAANLVISKGKMAKTDIFTVAGTGASKTVTFAWADDSGSGFKLATDIPFVVVVNEGNDEIAMNEGVSAAVDRSDEGITVDFDSVVGDGATVNGYLAFRRADGTIVSNTDYKSFQTAP